MSCGYCSDGEDMTAAVDGHATIAMTDGGRWFIESVCKLGFTSEEWHRMVLETADGEVDSLPIRYCPFCGERLE